MKVLGYAVPHAVSKALFKSLDMDGSGLLTYQELRGLLHKSAGAHLPKHELLRYAPEGQRWFQSAILDGDVLCSPFQTCEVLALPMTVKLDASLQISVVQQLGFLVAKRGLTVIRLFQDWDENRSGGVEKTDFWRAMIGLGYNVSRILAEALFDDMDTWCTGQARGRLRAGVGRGFITFEELNMAIHRSACPCCLVSSTPPTLYGSEVLAMPYADTSVRTLLVS